MDKYYSIFENHHTPMLIIDYNTGRIAEANTAACKYYGYSREEITGLNISDINIKNADEVFKEMEKAKFEERKIFRFKHRLADGTLREVEVYSGPVQLGDKSLLFSVIHDMEERNEFEERLKKQKSYFEDLFNNSPEAIGILDNDFRIMDVNKSFEEMFLYKIQDIKNRNITDVMCSDNYYNESTYLQECIRKGDFVRIESLRKRKDGKLIDVSILGFPIIAEGEKIGVYFIYTDLRIIKEGERQFKKSIENYINLLKTTIDGIPDVVSVLKPDLSVELINEAGCRFLNVSHSKLEGADWRRIVEAITGEYYGFAEITLKSKKPYHMEKYIKSIDRYVDWYCRPVLDINNEVILIVERIKDITKDKRYEEMLKSSKDRAEEESRMKTQFLANMSHEIRTPISGVIGVIDMLKDTALTAEQREYVDMLKFSADRLISLVNDVLDISKIEAGRLELRDEQFSLKKLLDKLLYYFDKLAENKGLKLINSVDSSMPDIVNGDPERLNQILFNLLGNAVKFTDDGYISLGAKLIQYIDDCAVVQFSVSDTGIGIREEEMGKLFNNFVQLNHENDRRYGGTGLGLALSKRLVELMGGSISAESQYNMGSTFKFSVKLNISGHNNKTAEDMDREMELKLPPGLKVLAAEDDSINQKIIRSIITKGGGNITLVSDGREVLKLIETQKFDVLLLDVCMPGIDGCEVTRLIREKEKTTVTHIPIIAMSAVAIKEEVDRCMSLGVDEYIIKPVRKSEVFKAILKLTENRFSNADFNLDSLMDRLEGNKELLAEIIEDAVSQEYENEFLGLMEKYISEKDYVSLRKHIHKFEGSLSHFENKSINSSLKNIREGIIKENTEEINESFHHLKHEFYTLKEYLLRCRDKYR